MAPRGSVDPSAPLASLLQITERDAVDLLSAVGIAEAPEVSAAGAVWTSKGTRQKHFRFSTLVADIIFLPKFVSCVVLSVLLQSRL